MMSYKYEGLNFKANNINPTSTYPSISLIWEIIETRLLVIKKSVFESQKL